jgi:hypothetical protein
MSVQCKGCGTIQADKRFNRVGQRVDVRYCVECGIAFRWQDDEDSVEAPADIARIAGEWHGGQGSGLYSLASTGRIFKSECRAIVAEMRPVLLAESTGENADILAQFMRGIEHLETLLPEDE